MSRYFLFLLVFSAGHVMAAPLTIHGGAYTGHVILKGDIGSSGHSQSVKDGLGYDRADQLVIYAGLEHQVPMLPDIRVRYSHLNESAQQQQPPMTIISDLTIDTADITFYYVPIRQPVRLNLGVGVRRLSIDFAIKVNGPGTHQQHNQPKRQVMPTAYAGFHGVLGQTGLYATATAYGSIYQDRRMLDSRVGVGWVSGVNVGMEIGYSYRIQKFSSDAIDIDLRTGGPYVSASLNF